MYWYSHPDAMPSGSPEGGGSPEGWTRKGEKLMSGKPEWPGDGRDASGMEERVLNIARMVLSELDVDRVLIAALDGLIDLCGAERGMILLFDPAGELLFEKARNLERQDLEHPEFQVSRTLIHQVRSGGKAFFDPYLPEHPTGRWSDSVYRLQLMAVICLPLIHGETVFGVVYLDTRNRRHQSPFP